ncbi:PAS domain S-box protein [Zoogloea sp.]|uniref:PAS domain S-box protein n=1 Tax=Zoogloea sp. TaxID=49181 RepID=UPI0025EE664A|nr:PAS domain S-box protein [Zoogloea sp.]MCK6393985.1 PAS domain S-box protein [Zoogloea sp.]
MWLDSFFLRDGDPTLLLYGTYDPGLVALSLLIAVLGSAMSLQLAGMARAAAHAAYRQVALTTGAVALGVATWAMHFIGMLAFSLCDEIRYAPTLTVLSMGPAMLASWVALSLLAREEIRPWQLALGGTLVGAGIGSMHYLGMAAMEMDAQLRYNPAWFLASILVAVVLAVLALWIRFGLARNPRFGGLPGVLAGGLVMGLAIAGMHYVAMAAARFVGLPDPNCIGNPDSNTRLALGIATVTVITSLVVAAANGFLRYRYLYQRLVQGESRLRAMVDTAVEGIITIDGRGRILSFNLAAERLFGWQAGEVIGRNVNMLMPEPDRSRHDGYLAHHLQTGEARIIGTGRDVTAVRKDGSPLPMRLSIGRVPIAGEDLFVGFVSDMSERQRMENALREREQQLRSLIDNMPGVCFRSCMDEHWSILFISDAVERVTGWRAADFIAGQITFTELIHPDDSEMVWNVVGTALAADRPYMIEYRLRTRSDEEIWVSETGSGKRDTHGQLQWIDGVLMDITDSKRRAAEFEGLANAVNRALAVLEIDTDQRIITANTPFLELTGYTLKDLCGQPHDMLCPPSELSSDTYRRKIDEDLRSGQFITSDVLRLGKDGRRVWMHATYNPIFDANGEICKVTMLAQDMTERRAMELALVDAKERAEQAAAARAAFLANMSHEIRTPMNAILGFTELLMDTALDDAQRRHLGTVRASARSLLGLLNDILDTAKLDKGAMELELADFSLRAVCDQTVASLRLGATRKGLDLRLDYPDSVAEHFTGDALRIQQVLLNLLGNAIKFTEQGQVQLQVGMDGEDLHLCISDTGIGIPADRLNSIFAPFAQADASTSRRFGGTGLGTTISRQLVELMGGHIRLESEVGVGSRFHVLLPLAPGKPQDTPAQAEQGLPPLSILVADDVAQNSELLTLLLGREGHRIVVANDGAEAVSRFGEQDFDLILMDVHMPGMDGLAAARAIRRRESHDNRAPTPIIALTASVLEEDRVAALAAGMNGFAVKPIELPRLKAEIARVCGIETLPTETRPRTAGTPAGAAIDWLTGTQRWGSRDALENAIRQFLANRAEHIAALSSTTARDSLRPLAHRIAGAAANLALPDVTACARQLETWAAGNEGPADAGAELATRLSTALNEAWAALPAPAAADAPHALADIAQLNTPLAQLATRLARGELDDAALAAVVAGLPPPLTARLQAAVDDFDFDRACAELTSLRTHLNLTPADTAP